MAEETARRALELFDNVAKRARLQEASRLDAIEARRLQNIEDEYQRSVCMSFSGFHEFDMLVDMWNPSKIVVISVDTLTEHNRVMPNDSRMIFHSVDSANEFVRSNNSFRGEHTRGRPVNGTLSGGSVTSGW